jgi:tetratricopeptide (TPR) repeat protein
MTEREFENTTLEQEEERSAAVLCPVCGEPVNNHPAEELYTVDLVESDFRVRTLDDDILDTWLVFCHHCFYVTHDFKQIPHDIEKVQDVIESEEYRERFADTNPTTMELFEHYLYMLEEVKALPMVFADTYLRMSWLYEDDGDMRAADDFREKAIQHFAKALLIGDLDDKEVSMIYYYIGELSRRKGEFDRAKKALLKMDMQVPMIKNLFDMQSRLLRDGNKSAVAMPREEN